MESARSEYPAMLAVLQPPQAVAVLNDRLRTITKLNNDVADWLQERRRIEEIYVQGLRKLARKTPPDESSELGIFTTPWQKILGATESMADAHQQLATKIDIDVEKPLREFATHNREMQAMSTVQGNLASLAKDYEAAQRKADKAKGKAGKSTDDLEAAKGHWDSQAPSVFESLQATDESRLNHLRDVLTQFQTHEADQVEKNRGTAESCLNSLLSIETADEIKTFAIRQSEGSGPRRPSERRESRTQSSGGLAPVVPSTSNEDISAQRSGSFQEDKPEEKKSRLGGLKRLGTVMGRRRSSQAPIKEQRTPQKKGPSNLGSSAISNGDQAETASHLSGWRAPSPGLGSPRFEGPTTTEETATSTTVPASKTVTTDDTLVEDSMIAEKDETVMTPGIVNGTNQSEYIGELQEPLNPGSATNDAPEKSQNDSEDFRVPPPALDPISQAERDAANNDDQSSPLKVDIRDERISEGGDEEAAMANMASTLRAQAAPVKRTPTNRGRRDVRSSVLASSPALQDPTGMSEPAITQSTMPPPVERTAPPAAGNPPVVAPFPATTPPLSSSLLAGQAQHRPSASDERGGSDAHSIHSSRSLGSTTQMIKHPDMHSPGLNSSIVETVSAWIDHGEVSRAVVIGELALSYNQTNTSYPALTETIRLDNFAGLEKVAPNPNFIKENLNTPGSYTVDLASIPRTNVAFKYQLRLDESNLANHAPILLSPAWKIEPHQSSVILTYLPNPAFSPFAPITLTNLVLVIHLDQGEGGTGKPNSCQSKPLGTFSKERSLVYWRMDELTLRPGAEPQKILARFATDGQAQQGRIEARWEISGAQADALGSPLTVSTADGGPTTDPFADEDAAGATSWKELKSVKRLVSGTYVAN